MAEVEKFSIEKIVSQKVYPEKFLIDEMKKTVLISGDRITSIHGINAAGELKLELTFLLGERNEKNPWGIYILNEKELF